MSDIEFQRLMNSETEQFLHKHSSNEIGFIHQRFSQEIEQVRNDMKDTDKTSAEYKALMQELEELEDERDAQIKKIENEDEVREEWAAIEDTQLETRYNAAKADKEGLESMQESNVKRNG